MRRPRSVVLRIPCIAVVAGTIVFAASGLAAAQPGFAPVQVMTASAASVSCPSVTSCTAVGGSGIGNPFVVVDTSGTWGAATVIALPAGGLGGELDSVTCTSTGNCLALGSYLASNGGTQPLLASESSGQWSAATSVAPPAAALEGSSEHAQFTDAWCASAGNCVAIGSFQISEYTGLPMTATEVSGVWSATAELPAVTGGGGFFYLTTPSLACTSAGNCTAVDGSDAWAETGGTWGIPRQITPAPFFTAHGIACPSPTTCIAVGAWTDADPPGALSLVETNGTWGGFNQRWFGDISSLTAISCEQNVCVAIGSAVSDSNWDPRSYNYGMAATWSNGSWSSLALTSTPFSDISCASTTQCLAIGAGVSSVVTPVGPVVAPFGPGVGAKPVLNGASVSFQYPYDDGGAPITSYSATAHPGGASCTTATTSCEITGLTNGRQYVVTATDNNGVAASQRSFSNHFFSGVAPTTPGRVHAVLSGSTAWITWHASTSPKGEPVLRYVVQVRADGRELRGCVTRANSCRLGGLLNGLRYHFFVSAIDATGASSAASFQRVVK